ncbi:MAG: 30S ribosomal protein S8 [Nanoarchaeota archaeon]|nr:30S ribosomal protein S8 [Nanoarchaeota archaeon]
MLNDTLASVLSKILNAEKIGMNECVSKPSSKLIKKVLGIMQDNGYIGDFKEVIDSRGNFVKINLIGRMNKCGVIKPRYVVKVVDYEKFEKRYLPAKDFGIIIVSTNKGIMTIKEAKEKKIGGRLLAYCY